MRIESSSRKPVTESPILKSPSAERKSQESRFSHVIATSPIKGILYGSGEFPKKFAEVNSRIDAVCIREQICRHGLSHGQRVAQNAFVLADMIAPTNEREGTLINDGNLAFLALVHDVGYADPSLVFEQKSAPDHPEASIRWLQGMQRDLMTAQDISPDARESLQVINDNFDFYRSLIQGVSGSTNQEFYTASNLLKLADKVDYFRAERVADVGVPKAFGDNAYFFLADAVEEYSLNATDRKIVYAVDLQRGWTVNQWQDAVYTHGYGWVFDIGEEFAQSIGRKFEIVEMEQAA